MHIYKAQVYPHTTNFSRATGQLINDAHDNFSFSFTNGGGLFFTDRLYRNNAPILQTFVEHTLINAPTPNLPRTAGLIFTVSAHFKRSTMWFHLQAGHYSKSSFDVFNFGSWLFHQYDYRSWIYSFSDSSFSFFDYYIALLFNQSWYEVHRKHYYFLQPSTGTSLTGSHNPVSQSILTFLFYLPFHLIISKIPFLLAIL